MTRTLPFLVSLLAGLASAQSLGRKIEKHPKLDTYKCTRKGGCEKRKTAVVIDSSSHPIYQKDNPSLGCGDWGSAPNKTVCPDEVTCQKNCIIDGISDYTKYGVKTRGDALYMSQLLADGTTVSPRLYLLAEGETKYEMLKLVGRELTFDVDVSKLPCGMNGALYLGEMDKEGGKGKLNRAGAAYGTGYCDAQCYTFPFVNGVGNIEGKGSCCSELDIWEANKEATSIAPHTCQYPGLYKCTGDECAFEGVCDKWGCGYNPYVNGNKDYYGPDKKQFTVDTSRPFSVVTQFPAVNGVMQAINRLYVQDGKVIQQAYTNMTHLPEQNLLNDEYCLATGGARRYMDLGATAGMGEALARGMVLTFAIWWDVGGYMQWLDGGNAGPCNATEGNPELIRINEPDTSVVFSKIKWGDIGSTF